MARFAAWEYIQQSILVFGDMLTPERVVLCWLWSRASGMPSRSLTWIDHGCVVVGSGTDDSSDVVKQDQANTCTFCHTLKDFSTFPDCWLSSEALKTV